jgi:hypothetical protein
MERERTVRGTEKREGVRDRGMKGIMSRERKKFQFTTEFPKCILCDFISIFLVLLSSLKA